MAQALELVEHDNQPFGQRSQGDELGMEGLSLELAIGEASAAVTEAVQDDRDVLLAKAGQEVDLGADAYHDALDVLAGAHAKLAQAVATRAWLTRFPEVSAVRPTLLVVPNLLAKRN